ncbi:uncharacterized protein LOC123873001 [Maniola jurtina]|uniref:uncharacterized protein LOC123873001 n=1 Tax=Maniola jurtina TaxID=191418 RepID=UPI001E688267|nr:uncharacterized protein LOC123873001 [Maniola jurtina]
MYSTWKLKELKDELKKRGGRITGKKSELVERLEAYDRNFNFGHQTLQASQSQAIDVPAVELYKDVNSSTILPKITKHHIQSYFDRFNKNICDAVKLYESRYLLVLRSATSGQDTYLKGYCKASMKQLQYEINIKLNNDGMPEEANCECAAGEGNEAHCKHIAVVLLAAENIVQQKIIILHEVSTSQLQTFHKPSRKYYATPLRASRFPSKRDINNTVFSPYLKQNPDFDKKAFQCRFQSMILNYPQSSMPIKQIYPVASQRSICLDHEYLEKSAIDCFLESMVLQNVSEQKILEIERETRGQSNNPKWHSYRKTHITASIFQTVCHLKTESLLKYSSQILHKTTIKTKAMAHGNINEKIAMKKYMDTFNLEITECGLFLSKERPYLGASPDGLLGSETIIEVKCPYSSRNKEVCPLNVPYLQYENGKLSLKKNNIYYYQIQGQLYVTKRKFCNLLVYTFKSLEVIFIDYDEEFIKYMLEKLDYFYHNFFKAAVIKKLLYKE